MQKNQFVLTFLIITVVFITPHQFYGQKLPTLWLDGMDGNEYNLQQFVNNSNIMINFWSLSCAPCQREMGHLDQFARTYDNETFQIISINVDSPKSLSRVKSYVQSKDYAFQIFRDPTQEIFHKLGGRLLPYSIFINESGIIESRHIGYAPGDEKRYMQIIQHMITK